MDPSLFFSIGNLIFARMNLKPAVLKNFVFDWALCFGLCEVYRFQNFVGLELPIKHALKDFNDTHIQSRFRNTGEGFPWVYSDLPSHFFDVSVKPKRIDFVRSSLPGE